MEKISNDIIVAFNEFKNQIRRVGSTENIYDSAAYNNLADLLVNLDPQELRVLIYEEIFDIILDASGPAATQYN